MKVLIKEYASLEAFREDCEQSLNNGAVLLSTTEKLTNREHVEVKFHYAGQQNGPIKAEVVYLVASGDATQVGLSLLGDWKEQLAAWAKETVKKVDVDQEPWGKDSESLYHAIQKMTMTEKVQLAVRAGKQERQILMKDQHHQVHIYLLKNPRISSDEVARMSKSMNINTEMLIDISNNADWMKQGSIRLSVIKNPRTPMTVVKKHMQQVNDNDLLMLAKSESVREAVNRLAKSLLASKGKKFD